VRFVVAYASRDTLEGWGMYDLPCTTPLEAWNYLERERPWWALKRIELIGPTP
jgi:hypothetical protein